MPLADDMHMTENELMVRIPTARTCDQKGGRSTMDKYDIFSAALAEFQPLGINIRTIKALAGGNICTVSALTESTANNLAKIRGMGPSGIRHLRKYLRPEGGIAELQGSALISVRFDPAALTGIDAWALAQNGVVSRAEAIRQLVAQALAARPGRNEGKKAKIPKAKIP
jgi:hypothetical protein